MKLWITTLIAGACLAFSTNILMAQPTDGPGPGDRVRRGNRRPQRDGEQARLGQANRQRDGERAGQRPPFGPFMIALDRDKDGVLSAREIAAASASLKKLDKNGDGKIDRVELRPHRPRGGRDGDAKGLRDGKGPRGGQDGNRRPPRGEGDGQRRQQRGTRDGSRRPPRPPAGPQE